MSFPFRIDFPPELPISARAGEIVSLLQEHQVVIVAGETGSGKSTQLPKLCLTAGRGTKGRIACTQPRRVAALSLSRRVAEELGVDWGSEVGCKVRFNDETSDRTVVKFMTDGMLLAEVQGDPMLRAYDTVIVDEAHERSLNIDFLIGHLRQLRFRRPELQIVITSATIDTEAFSAAFDGAPVVSVSGRTYPVEVVWAPLDSLGSDAAEDDDPEARAEALHYVDGAVEAVRRILDESPSGDVLVFMPSERDIRECCDLLDGDFRGARRRPELIPLFGRLSNAEQQRVFAPSQARKIVVATNIAETSLTIPGIRFVVDTGLARMSRYAPLARTRRLPIEAIAQSSADQRKGRAGRVSAGVCIRLYSEKDYNERPRFTQPEIQRANLADVILRLKAYGLGDIERFPFLNPPSPKAIRAGYLLLEELGALDAPDGQPQASPSLTRIGRELARLPVDPTVGRMILQAREERCLREVLVIAAGLSIQDPRERPLEKQAAADAAHRRFAHPDSDFLTLLNIWEAFQGEFERLTQARLRRFCHDHFLSYVRLREWRDLHAQLLDVLGERRDFQLTSVRDGLQEETAPRTDAAPRRRRDSEHDEAALLFGSAGYRAIHRSVLAGLLGNVARLDEDGRTYLATHDRRVSLFPGSVLFTRDEPKRRQPAADAGEGDPKKAKPKTPRWLIASEIVETTRVYARTCARLDPRWLLDLGGHIVKASFSEPFWDPAGGRVLVRKRTRLYGLEIDSSAVSYGRINPAHAAEIFIREGLVADTVTWPFPFLEHNRRVRDKLEFTLTRMRDRGYLNLDEALYRFYARHLCGAGDGGPPAGGDAGAAAPAAAGPSSVPELVAWVRRHQEDNPRFLFLEPEDLRNPDEQEIDPDAFPESLPLENRVVPLAYAYRPGQDDDGVTLELNVRSAAALTPAALDWAVPGHTAEKVEHYLRALPKELRRAFVPLAETVKTVTAAVEQLARLRGSADTLEALLAEHLRERFGLRFDPAVWKDKPPPDHLRVRIRVSDDEGREICATRDLAALQAALEERSRDATATAAREDPATWRQARRRWERPPAAEWAFGDLPVAVVIGHEAGLPLVAHPGLRPEPEGVALRLFRGEGEARTSTEVGLARLLELQLGRDLGWLERDLKALRPLGPLAAPFAALDGLQADAFACLRRWLCDPVRIRFSNTTSGNDPDTGGARGAAGAAPVGDAASRPLLTAAAFAAGLETARVDLRGLVPRLVELLREILTLRQELLLHPQPYAGLRGEVEALVPAHLFRTTPYPQLMHLPRYLRGLRQRADRWRQNPVKDAERSRLLAPYRRWLQVEPDTRTTPARERLRWLVEEYRVSLFAQELGTATPVSAKKIDAAVAALDATSAPSPALLTTPAARGEPPAAGQSVSSQAKAPAASAATAKAPASAVHPSALPGSAIAPAAAASAAANAAGARTAPAGRPKALKSLSGLDALLRRG